jgi:predicted CopG family antitoxin
MKCHISATIDAQLLGQLKKMSREEKRSFSNLIELAVERMLKEKPVSTELFTTTARFADKFNRAETYERDHR